MAKWAEQGFLGRMGQAVSEEFAPLNDETRLKECHVEVPVALGRIPSGLFVITWIEASRDRGMLASWVMQAGFEPPAISIAVGKTRGFLSCSDKGSRFVLNLLGESQRPMVARFGRPSVDGFDPFEGITVSRSPCGLAILGSTATWLECSVMNSVDSGDHRVIVASVACGGAESTVDPPLIHLRKNGLRY